MVQCSFFTRNTWMDFFYVKWPNRQYLLQYLFTILTLGEWSSGLRCCNRIRRFPVQTPLGTRLSLGTQPSNEASGGLCIKIVKRQWLTSGEWGISLDNDAKLAVVQPNRNLKKCRLNYDQRWVCYALHQQRDTGKQKVRSAFIFVSHCFNIHRACVQSSNSNLIIKLSDFWEFSLKHKLFLN